MDSDERFIIGAWETRWLQDWHQVQAVAASMAQPSAGAVLSWARRLHGDTAATALDNVLGALIVRRRPE